MKNNIVKNTINYSSVILLDQNKHLSIHYYTDNNEYLNAYSDLIK